MRSLRAFVLGAVAIGVLAYTLAAALAVAAQAGGRGLDVALGPLTIVSVAEEQSERITTFGPGLLVLALAGGLVNLATARWMQRRSVGSVDRVD